MKYVLKKSVLSFGDEIELLYRYIIIEKKYNDLTNKVTIMYLEPT